MFLDASAIVAIMVNEPDAGDLAGRIERATTEPCTSPVAVLESILALVRITKESVESATEAVHEFLAALDIRLVSITPEIGDRACEGYASFGRLTGHPAGLNMGDAFAYGCAKHLRVPLLYKGNDFVRTDIG
jgi:ribonuclease VapC